MNILKISFSRLAGMSTVACLLATFAFPVAAQKLYRWTDKDGKVHYSDQVPPDAVDNARSELNDQGIAIKKVERAMTAEERAALEAEAEALAEQQRLTEEKARHDDMLLTSYPDEAALERAYTERFDLLDQSIESARIGVQSQRKSLGDLLAHAAMLEKSGKPVPASINQSIALARKQLAEQSEYTVRREEERKALETEHTTAIANYREIKAKFEKERAENSSN